MFAKIEKALVDRGQVGAAVKVQKIARVFETPTDKKAQRKWIEDAMGCELKTHLLLQSEHGDFAARNRLEQCQSDGVVLTKEQQEVMDSLQDSLRMYNKKWWFQTRIIMSTYSTNSRAHIFDIMICMWKGICRIPRDRSRKHAGLLVDAVPMAVGAVTEREKRIGWVKCRCSCTAPEVATVVSREVSQTLGRISSL